jgi:hypothetical protein
MNIYEKLNAARKAFHQIKLKKTGRNDFAKYDYFELGDFLLPALGAFNDVGLTAIVAFDEKIATMTIVDCEKPKSTITITSPMGSAALKGCHEVQNIGAVETYQRRYLWVAALEIVEHDALEVSETEVKVDMSLLKTYIDDVKKITTDADALAYWKEKSLDFKDKKPEYDELKSIVSSRRNAIKKQQEAKNDTHTS